MNTDIILIDTHIHPVTIMEKEEASRKTAFTIAMLLEEAKQKNIQKMICVGTNYEENIQNVAFAETYSELYAAVGLHPCDINLKFYHDDINKSINLIHATKKKTNKIIAIGEVGLDFYWPGFDEKIQEECFCRHIECAIELDLPIIIHSRNAADQTLNIIKRYNKAKGVVHCFSEGPEHAEKWLEIGFYLGVGGSITYPANQKTRDAILLAGSKNIVLETDSPFLSPQGFRGQINKPHHTQTVAAYLAILFNIPIEELAKDFLQTTYKCFPGMK